MPEILLNQTPVLGGAGTVYQRKEGGPWYLYFWVKSERKRFRQSLETTDRPLAIRTAEQLVLDALARQQVGQTWDRMQPFFCPGQTKLNLNQLLGLRDSHQVPA